MRNLAKIITAIILILVSLGGLVVAFIGNLDTTGGIYIPGLVVCFVSLGILLLLLVLNTSKKVNNGKDI